MIAVTGLLCVVIIFASIIWFYFGPALSLIFIAMAYAFVGLLIASVLPDYASPIRKIKTALLWLPGLFFDRVFYYMDS